jgi:triacylglycerol lipase
LQCVVAGGAPCEFRLLPAESKRLAFWLGGSRAEKPDAYVLASPASFITKDDPPTFFYHGEADTLVPLASPQLMLDKMSKAGVPAELHMVAKAGHVQAFYDQQALDAAIKFLDAHLK